MITKDNLLKTIHLLTPSEKKHFKQYISTRKDSKFYAALFDQLVKQEEYDAPQLARKLKKTTKQISDAKAYLLQVLLRALENYHRDTIPQIHVSNIINQSVIIRMKGLNDLALELLDRAESIAAQYDYFLSLIHIEKLRQTINATRYDFASTLSSPTRIDRYMDQERNLGAYRELHKKGVYLTTPNADPAMGITPDSIISHPLLRDPSAALSMTALTFYHRISIMYHIYYGDKSIAYQYSADLYQLIRDNPDRFDDIVKGGSLLACMPGLLYPLGRDKFYAAANDLEEVANRVGEYDRNFYLGIQGGMILYRIMHYTGAGMYAESIRYFERLRAEKYVYENISPVPRALILADAAFCYFFEGQPDTATRLIHEAEDIKVKVVSTGRSALRLRMLQALIACEEGNATTMDSQIIAAKRYSKALAYGLKELNYMHKVMTRLLDPSVSKKEILEMADKSEAMGSSITKYSQIRLFHFDTWVRRRAAKR